jgi:hypothetical protein
MARPAHLTAARWAWRGLLGVGQLLVVGLWLWVAHAANSQLREQRLVTEPVVAAKRPS